MKDLLLIVAVILSFIVAYIPVIWAGKFIKDKRSRNTSVFRKK